MRRGKVPSVAFRSELLQNIDQPIMPRRAVVVSAGPFFHNDNHVFAGAIT